MNAMERTPLIHNLASMILQVEFNHSLRVAIDGVDASVKTTLAYELKNSLKICHFTAGWDLPDETPSISFLGPDHVSHGCF